MKAWARGVRDEVISEVIRCLEVKIAKSIEDPKLIKLTLIFNVFRITDRQYRKAQSNGKSYLKHEIEIERRNISNDQVRIPHRLANLTKDYLPRHVEIFPCDPPPRTLHRS